MESQQAAAADMKPEHDTLTERLAAALANGTCKRGGERVDAPPAVVQAQAEILARYDAWLRELAQAKGLN